MSLGAEQADALVSAAVQAATEVDPELLTSLVSRLDGMESERAVRRLIENELPTEAAASVAAVFSSGDLSASSLAIATAVRAVQAVRDDLGVTTTVWSGPTVRSIAIRPTRQVVMEMVSRARASLTLVTFVSGGIDDLVEALDEARKERKVKVRLIVETKEDSKDGQGPEAAAAFKNTRKAVPVYRWPKANRGDHGGTMHVKAVVQDRQSLLLSSANLTSAAFDRNMELGVLIEGGHLPERIDRHFDELIDAGDLVMLTP